MSLAPLDSESISMTKCSKGVKTTGRSIVSRPYL